MTYGGVRMRLASGFKYVSPFRSLLLARQLLGGFLTFLIFRRSVLEIYIFKAHL